MSSRYIVKILNANNNQSLLDFYSKPMSSNGKISLILDYSPDIWNALKVEGDTSEIFMVEDSRNNQIAGLAILSQKECFFHGKTKNVGYVSGLKVNEDYYGTIVIALLFKSFKEYCSKRNIKLWFYSVFNDNEKGLKLFGKSNKRLPIFEPLETMQTYIFKRRYMHSPKGNNGIEISQGTENDIESIVEYIRKEGQSRAFLPAYTSSQILSGKGLLNGLSVSDIAIARDGNEIVGIMGLWNQSVFRRWKVMGYSSIINTFLPLVNIGTKVFGYPDLPAIYSNVEYKIFSLILIQNNNDDVFKLLFNYLMKNDKAENSTYSISLKSNDALNMDFNKRSIAFSNTIYKTYWKEDEVYANELNVDNLYIEQGGL